MTSSTNPITPAEARTMLEILTKHDGSTLTPERDYKGRAAVSNLFDKLRFNLGIIADKEGCNNENEN